MGFDELEISVIAIARLIVALHAWPFCSQPDYLTLPDQVFGLDF